MRCWQGLCTGVDEPWRLAFSTEHWDESDLAAGAHSLAKHEAPTERRGLIMDWGLLWLLLGFDRDLSRLGFFRLGDGQGDNPVFDFRLCLAGVNH
jgi:hypothetical protein